MSTQDCFAAVDAAVGELATKREWEALRDGIFERLAARKAFLQASEGLSDLDAGLKAAQQLGDDARIEAAISKRNAAYNLIKRTEHVAWVKTNFGNNLARGVESLITGIQSARGGTRVSVASQQMAVFQRYMAGMERDLNDAGVMRLFTSGAMEKDVWLASHALGAADEAAQHAKLPPEAVKIAKIVDKWQEQARMDANASGAYIGKVPGYVTRRSHDADRIERAGEAKYVADGRRLFDLQRMVGERETLDVDAMLKGIYRDMASDNHGRQEAELVGKGPGSVGKKLSQERTIFFRDGEASWEYNQSYGTKGYAPSVASDMLRMSKATGIMRQLGPNPKANLDAIVNDLAQWAKDQPNGPALVKQLDAAMRGKLDKQMATVDGRADIVGSYTGARLTSNILNLQAMAKLGGMLFAQLGDLVQHGTGARYAGRSFFSGMYDMIKTLGTTLKSDEERAHLASALGVVLDNWSGEVAHFGTFDHPGTMSSLMQTFMKVNGADWWTRSGRYAAATGLSHQLALNAGRDFASLSPELQRVLGQYKIGAKEWEAIRASEQVTAKGSSYIVPENIADPKIADQYRLYLSDQTSFMQLEPDAKTRAMLLMGTQPGTWIGAFARFVAQFKSFNTAFLQKTVGRELFARGYEHDAGLGGDIARALRSDGGQLGSMTNLILWTTLFGYGSMSLKDLAKNKTPRDPTKSGSDLAKVALAAMTQGGGMGIYGDFLFGEYNRMGGSFASTAFGPTLGAITGAADVWQKIRTDLEDANATKVHKESAAALLSGTLNHTPFINLFYTRAVLDYFLTYRIQEAISPGHLQRVKQDMDKQKAQHFILPPQVH